MLESYQLELASSRAEEQIYELCLDNPYQWNRTFMDSNIRETYKALKRVWSNGDKLESISHLMSEQAYKLLLSQSRCGSADIKYIDVLDCFDYELESFLIISVINFAEAGEDYFVTCLNNQHSYDLDTLNIFQHSSNNYWTFKWSKEQRKWILHNIALNSATNSYLHAIGKNLI